MKSNPVPNKLCLAAFLSLALLLTGCFDTIQEYTINPDGSGKVVHQCIFQHPNLTFGFGDAAADPQEALHDAIRDVLKGATGVEAWRDVTFKQVDSQRILFHGTAYFKDLSKLVISNQTFLDFTWQTAADGKLILTLRADKSTADEGLAAGKEPVPAATLSPEEKAMKRQEDQAKYQQSKPMLAAFLGSMKQETVFHLPGKVSQFTNFDTQPSGALKITFSGAKLLEVMDKLETNDAWMEKNPGATSMDEKPVMNDEMNGMLFGTKGPVEAVVTGPAAPLFDYAAEVAAAKLDFAKTEKELGISAASIAPAAQGEPLKNLRVAGVRLVTESDSKRGLRPFEYYAGYTLALCADFAGSVLAVTDKSRVETAIADDGSSLLPESASGRNINFPHLSTDKTAVVFEVPLRVPGTGVSGLKELSGHLQYTVAGGTKEVDLGISELKDGAKGTEYGAQVVSIKEGWQKNGSQEMEVKLNLSADAVKSVTMIAGGNKTVLEQNGYFGSGTSCTLTLSSKQSFPAQARLTAEVYDKLQTFEVPFKLDNITLLGRPAAK